jgi:hypothetical protein
MLFDRASALTLPARAESFAPASARDEQAPDGIDRPERRFDGVLSVRP